MRHYGLAALSGVLLALVFYPFYIWPLAFVALAPLYYVAAEKRYPLRAVFISGCITGIIVAVPLVFYTLAQLVPGFGSPLFTFVIQASAIPALIIISVLFGAMTALWRQLRTGIVPLDLLAAASLYVIVERTCLFISEGYYPDSLANAVVSLPLARTCAAVGGMPLVSFLVALTGCTLVEVFFAWQSRNARAIAYLCVGFLAVGIMCCGYTAYLAAPRETLHTLAVSVIQTVPPPTPPNPLTPPAQYGAETGDVFSDPWLQPLIVQAAQGSDLVIYPDSPAYGGVYRGAPDSSLPIAENVGDAAVGAWIGSFTPPKVTVLVWNVAAEGRQLFYEYAAWQAGAESTYQKHRLAAFSDYTPPWAHLFGMVDRASIPISPSTSTAPLVVDGVPAAGLICSELRQDSYARAETQHTSFIIAAGVDAFFPGAILGNDSLATARYRAAESDEPLIRANNYGPSAIIDARGNIQTQLPYGDAGILRGVVSIQKPKATLYSRFGAAPLYILMLLFMCGAYYVKRYCSI